MFTCFDSRTSAFNIVKINNKFAELFKILRELDC